MPGSIVQAIMVEQANTPNTSGTLPHALTIGNVLAVFAVDPFASGGTLGASSSTEGTLTQTSEGNFSDADGNTLAMFWKAITVGGSGTVTCTTNHPGLAFWVLEITGVSALDSTCHAAVDQVHPGTGTDAITSGTEAITASTAFMTAVVLNASGGTGVAAAGTGFTSSSGTNITVTGWQIGQGHDLARLEWQAGMSGTKAATFTDATNGSTNDFDTLMMAFAETGGGGTADSAARPGREPGLRLGTPLSRLKSNFQPPQAPSVISSQDAGAKPGWAVALKLGTPLSVLRSANYSDTATNNFSIGLTGVSASSTVGTVTASLSIGITGVSGTSSVGNVSPENDVALTQVSATGSVGTVTPVSGGTVGLTQVIATGSVGTLFPETDIALTQNAATGSVGSVIVSASLTLSQAATTGSVGSLSPYTTLGLTGISATGSVGSLTVTSSSSVSLTGVSATGYAGSVSPSGSIGGSELSGYVGFLANPSVLINKP